MKVNEVDRVALPRRRRRHRVVVEDRSVAPVWPRWMAARRRSAGGRWWSWRSWSIQRSSSVYRVMSRPVVAMLGELECWVTFSPHAQRWLHVVSWCSPSQDVGLYARRPRRCERDPTSDVRSAIAVWRLNTAKIREVVDAFHMVSVYRYIREWLTSTEVLDLCLWPRDMHTKDRGGILEGWQAFYCWLGWCRE